MRERGQIRTDRTAVFPVYEGAHLVSEIPAIQGKAHVEVLVDQNLIEVYINDGEYTISNAVYGLSNQITGCGIKEIRLYTAGE